MNKSRRIQGVFILMVALGTLVVFWPLAFSSPNRRLSQAAGTALSRGQWKQAQSLARQCLNRNPDDAHCEAVVGIASARLHDVKTAIDYLERQAPQSAVVSFELGKQYLKSGRLWDAEHCFRNAIQLDNRMTAAHRQLAMLLSFEGRCAEAAPHLLAEIRSGGYQSDQLCLLGIPDRIVRRDETLRDACEKQSPDDPLHELGKARILLADHHLEMAESIVKRAVQRYPDLPLARGLLGQIYIQTSQEEKLLEWHKSLSESTTDHPSIWFVRSQWARKTGQTASAIRCLLEVLKSQPSHIEANYQLSQSFKQLADVERADYFSKRSLLLSKLAYVVNDLRDNPNAGLMQQAAEALESLGYGWEAMGWCQLAQTWSPGDWVSPMYERLRPRVSIDTDRIFAEHHPLNGIRLEDYPLPTWKASEPDSPAMSSDPQESEIHFSDSAPRLGLDFEYFNSMDPEIGLEHIFQTTGGGVGVIDFDMDRWPDLYFGNGRVLTETLPELSQPQRDHSNALYRNRRGERFDRIDGIAMEAGDRFGQGVAAGDYNSDGFPDLYAGNVGPNRLYQNNGDGTFSDVSIDSGTDGDSWTMSAMIADIDGDGLSDIYSVNYLDQQEVFERSCKRDGQPLTCAPTLFSAAQDRLYRNLGNGAFEDVTDEWGIRHPNGKGLGVVGFSATDRQGLQIFVANDTTENLYFQTGADYAHYRENAVLAGLAMSESGTMQACMGVAAGDADGDGSTDLFVTNFIADSNTMYLQTFSGFFSDTTRNSGLARSSYSMVGFGTQFIDADIDGQLDLIVTNGHVDQTFATSEPDRMPPQFYRNRGAGRFTELNASSLGTPFQQKRFGRALARLDWNRDLKNDACIVHLASPVALVTNETLTTNKSIMLTLKGTTASRDAVGTIVTLTTSKGSYSRQLTGGDGYQASNERRLNFGLSPDENPVSLRVQWGDDIEEFPRPDVGDSIIIQGGGLFAIKKAM